MILSLVVLALFVVVFCGGEGSVDIVPMQYPPGFDRKGKIEGAESSGLSTQILPHSHAHSHSTSGGDKKEEKEKEKEKDGGLKLGGGFSKWGKR